MEYRALQRTGRDAFTEELNKAAAEGYRVISAGASFNTDICGFEWWAIVGRGAEAAEEPKDEAAELLEAAKKIADICSIRQCEKCPLKIKGGCAVRIPSELGNLPRNWRIAKEGR